MLDPIPVPPLLRDAVQPLANALHLGTLPLHIHEVLGSYVLYSFIYACISPFLSARLFPRAYTALPRRTQLQWDMHVTSFVNALFLSGAASYVLCCDAERLDQTWQERIWGYTGAAGLVQAFGAGYFLWDVQVCVKNVEVLGVLDLLHAVVGLAISILGFVCGWLAAKLKSLLYPFLSHHLFPSVPWGLREAN